MTVSEHRQGLSGLVRDAARRSPDAPAVYDGTARATYRELDGLADRYAAGLAEHGVGPGDRVVIWAAKSIETIAVMQAALRLGAVYVPVPPSSPVARVNRIAAGCEPAVVATDDGGSGDAELLALVTFSALWAAGAERAAPPPPPISLDDPAYILYTSGSTGEPKGVCVSHRNALAFVCWAAEETGLVPTDRLANHAPLNFDLSVFDLYAAFHAGASVDLVPAALAYAPERLAHLLRTRGITVWYSVPSALVLMMRDGGLLAGEPPASLRVCVFAGEPFPLTDALRLRASWPGVRMFNWYGPTETNVCTSYEVTTRDLSRTRPLPIGTACSGDRVWLDPPGADVGEIVVEGPTVMHGYWGRSAQSGPYRTGDLGRLDADGNLEYSGRRDEMVKVRGHRVEPGEVEAVLAAHPSVAAAAVFVAGAGLEARLHAVIVAEPGRRPTLLMLKAQCAAHLPTYMIVDAVTLVDRLPRTRNGKVDRAALADLCASPGIGTTAPDRIAETH